VRSRAHDPEPYGSGIRRRLDRYGTDGPGPPCTQLIAVHDGPKPAVVGAPHGHQLLRPGEGVVGTEAEQLLRTQTPCREHQVTVPEVGADPRRGMETTFIRGHESNPHSTDGRWGIETSTHIVIVEQQNGHAGGQPRRENVTVAMM
jgi:hypothetical protein